MSIWYGVAGIMTRALSSWIAVAAVAQVCNTAIPATTPTASFVDNSDGTVTDQTTGLMWKRCPEGQSWSGSACTGAAGSMTWQSALQGAATATYAGHRGCDSDREIVPALWRERVLLRDRPIRRGCPAASSGIIFPMIRSSGSAKIHPAR